MMWQSSMLISLLVLSHEQIIVAIWGFRVKNNTMYRGPITLLHQLVVRVSWHNQYPISVKNSLKAFVKFFFLFFFHLP